MKKISAWVIFGFGALITSVCFGAALYLFIVSFWAGEDQAGVQALGFGCALIGIPFYFLARFGWRLCHQASPQRSHPTLAQALAEGGIERQAKPAYDPTEKILAIIDVLGDRALVFTNSRLIVAHLYESAPGWAFPLALFAPGSNMSGNKGRRVKKLRPDQTLLKTLLTTQSHIPPSRASGFSNGAWVAR